MDLTDSTPVHETRECREDKTISENDRSEIWETLRVWVQIPRNLRPGVDGHVPFGPPVVRTPRVINVESRKTARRIRPLRQDWLQDGRQKLPTQVPVLPSRHSQRRAARAALRVRVRQVRGRRRRAHCAAAFNSAPRAATFTAAAPPNRAYAPTRGLRTRHPPARTPPWNRASWHASFTACTPPLPRPAPKDPCVVANKILTFIFTLRRVWRAWRAAAWAAATPDSARLRGRIRRASSQTCRRARGERQRARARATPRADFRARDCPQAAAPQSATPPADRAAAACRSDKRRATATRSQCAVCAAAPPPGARD